MNDRVVIKGLLFLDERGEYALAGFRNLPDKELLELLDNGGSSFKRWAKWGNCRSSYAIELDLPRPVLNKLSLKVTNVSELQVASPSDERPHPAAAPAAEEKLTTEPTESTENHSAASAVNSECPPSLGEAVRDGEPTLLERIEERLRDAGGSLPWTAVEVSRPVSIKRDVFRAAIAKRFQITKRGRGETVSLRK